MIRTTLVLFSLFIIISLSAQTDKEKLTGEWKFYLKDKISFEYLKLNADGTGIKCFGQTINGKDSLLLNHITTLLITNWLAYGDVIYINSKNTVSFKVNPKYTVHFIGNNKIELEGEHLVFNLYPSVLNRQMFQRAVTYQKAETIPKGYGINTADCIFNDRKLISYKPVDSSIQIVEYKGHPDLIPHLVGCNQGFEFAQSYPDPSYSLKIPISNNRLSFGFGDKNFYISFNSDSTDKSETSIVVYYDFEDENKKYYFSQIKNGEEKGDVIKKNNLDIYKTINWQGKYEGKVFLKNSIFVAYYTRDKNLEEKLQECITSFHYK